MIDCQNLGFLFLIWLTPLPRREYRALTVPELKAALKERDLPVSGKKADLVARLEGSQWYQQGGERFEMSRPVFDKDR